MTTSSLALKMKDTTSYAERFKDDKGIQLLDQSTQNNTFSNYTLGSRTFLGKIFDPGELTSLKRSFVFPVSITRSLPALHIVIATSRIQIIESNSSENLERRWKDYLSGLPQASNGRFNFDFVTLLKRIRDQLHNFLKFQVDPPDVFEGEDGGLQLVWERKNLLLSVDIIESDNIEWFLKNKETKKYWGFEGISIDNFPPSDLQKILISQKFNT